MTEVVTDVAELKENYTPKQRENFENHLQPKLDRLDRLGELAEQNGADVDIEAAKKWYLRTYRPKKRGDGLMERDHVQIGEPEHYFKKWLGKLNNAWGSIDGLVMASFGISDDVKDEVEDAATAVWVADHLKNEESLRKLGESLKEHDKVSALYTGN